MATPQLKHQQIATELGQQLEQFLQQPLMPTAEQLAQAEVEAQKLIFPDYTRYYAYQCLGLIEALRGNERKTIQYFKKAKEANSSDTSVSATYAQSLRYLGKIKESIKQLDFYVSNKTCDIFSLNMALKLCIIFGQTTKAELFMQQLKQLDPKAFLSYHQTDIEFTQLWQKTGIPENAILDYLEHAYQFAAERNINLRHPEIVLDVEDGNSLMYIFRDNDLTTDQRIQYEQELDKHMLSYIKSHKDYPFENIVFFLGRYRDSK
ncbi:hypothetical protein P9986_06645 [Glaesserella parasuis]|uniref:tetratricopeptide repeat protein n=1 Tax=Glaesserella parasuis TaxID=738 RepID=UPI0024364A99|nr:hypothetical protein [Glaesserella parasuis]MDG6327197.1 hypothetical protein [Glaesserella parasuis]